MKFTQLARDLKEKLQPLYLIEGEEAYFRDHAVLAIRDAMGITQPLLNDVRVEGESLKGDLSAFRDNLYALPFLDEKRLVRVYEFYPTEREWENFIKPYSERPCSSTVLLIVNAGKKTGACDMKKKAGVTYVDCGRESEEMLSRWLFGLVRRQGITIDTDAAELLVSYCACDAARMRLEIKKLAPLAGGRITSALVKEYVAKDVEYKIYELTQAASRRDFTAFPEIASDLMLKGMDENGVLSALVSHFRMLTEVANMAGSDKDVSAVLGIKPFAVQKNRQLVSRLGREKAASLYKELFSLLAASRSGAYTKAGAYDAAVAKIFFS